MEFRTYIGVKQIKATPMTRGEYNKYRGWKIPKDEDPKDEGYLVEYTGGYQSWSPKDAFEKSHFTVPKVFQKAAIVYTPHNDEFSATIAQ